MKNPLFRLFAFGIFSLFMAGAEAAPICLIDGRGENPLGTTDCPTTPNSCGSSVSSPYLGAALTPGISATPIDVHGRCRYIDSASDQTFFVPFASAHEWIAFLENAPSHLAKTTCARPFSGISEASNLYFGKTSARPDLGDTGDAAIAPVSLPYARTGSSWPLGETCPKASHAFRNSCYEEVPTYKCWNMVSRTCQAYSCAASAGGVCTSPTPYTFDCSYCADPGSTCEKKWHAWSETFDFVANALDSDKQTPSWQGVSKRIAGSLRPTACTTRCTTTDKHCTGCAGSCVPNGTTSCSSGTLKDSCGRAIGKCCTPDGLAYCVSGRKLDSCGNDIGVCNQSCVYEKDIYKRTDTLAHGETLRFLYRTDRIPRGWRNGVTIKKTYRTIHCNNGSLALVATDTESKTSGGKDFK